MSKKELQDKIDNLIKDNNQLKISLDNLNENTVIQSMNDMRDEYLELQQNSISYDVYFDIKNDHKFLLSINKAISQINNINIKHLNILIERLMHINITPNDKNIINNTLNSLKNRLGLIDEIICNYESEDDC